jgi:hypothetical protein
MDNECPVDDVSALQNQLEDQRDLLAQQLKTLDAFLEKMGVENVKTADDRDVDQLKDVMKGIASIFGYGSSTKKDDTQE